MWARIEENTVVEKTAIDPDGRFHSSLVWVACSADTELGMRYQDEEFHAPPPVVVDVPTAIANERYKREIAGIVLAGMPIETDDRSKTLIAGAALKAMRDPDFVLRWKTPAGFVDLPAAQVLMIADAVSDHVQACFNRESTLLDALAAGTFAESMLAEGWPA
jgi:hypothetical protein